MVGDRRRGARRHLRARHHVRRLGRAAARGAGPADGPDRRAARDPLRDAGQLRAATPLRRPGRAHAPGPLGARRPGAAAPRLETDPDDPMRLITDEGGHRPRRHQDRLGRRAGRRPVRARPAWRRGPGMLLGSTRVFDDTELARRYPGGPSVYAAAFLGATSRAVAAGFLWPRTWTRCRPGRRRLPGPVTAGNALHPDSRSPRGELAGVAEVAGGGLLQREMAGGRWRSLSGCSGGLGAPSGCQRWGCRGQPVHRIRPAGGGARSVGSEL